MTVGVSASYGASLSSSLSLPSAAPAIATVVQNVERLKLDFDRQVLVHSRSLIAP